VSLCVCVCDILLDFNNLDGDEVFVYSLFILQL